TVSSVTFAPNSRLTTIDHYAFSYLVSLKQITLPASVESIGDGAFASCGALETVTFAEGSRLSSLGYMPFSGCNSLTAISIPESANACKTIDGVLYSGDGTTLLLYPAGKTGKSFTTPAGVTTIADGAFSNTQLHNITLSEGVTTIGKGAFNGCFRMQSVSLPSTLTSISNSAFTYCMNLTTVTIPASVTSIGHSAFEGCGNLTTVTIPASVTSIGNSAFAFCDDLTEVTIPASVTSIGEYAFAGCSGLTTVTFPASVSSIGEYAFEGCDALTTVNAPCTWDGSLYTFEDTVTVIVADHAFADGACTACGVTGGYCGAAANAGGVQSVVWTYRNGVLTIKGEGAMADYEGGNGRPWHTWLTSLTSVYIGEGVETVGLYAFMGFTNLSSLNLAEGLKVIGDNAFAGCFMLETVVLPSSLTSIGGGAFFDSNALTGIVIPEGVKTIGRSAFLRCTALTTVTLPASVTSIGEGAFEDCTALTTVNVPCAWMETPLYTFGGGVTLDYVPHDYDEGGVCTLCNYVAKASIGRGADVLYFDTLPDALAAVEKEDIINVLADCDEDITIPGECKWYGSDFTCSGTVVNNGMIYEGVFTGHVTNSGSIVGGTFDGEVTNQMMICGGTFNNAVTNDGHLSSGEFNGVLTNNATIDNVAGVSWFTIGDDFVLINNGTLTCESHIDPTVANCQHGEICRLCGEYGQKDPANHTYASNVCCGVYGENLRWTLTDGTLAITGTGEMPESASASDVPWYDVREAITSVRLPDGLETIASYAFDGCSAMTSINIPLSVTYIGNGAFNGCTALTTVNVPCTWENSWLYAFENGDVLQIGDHQSIEIVWEWREDSAYAYAYKHCTDCDTYTDSTDGDAEVTETEAGDCAHPGSRVFTATLTFSDSTVVTGTHTVTIPSENHVGPMNNGFCAACGGFEMPGVDPGEYEDETWDDTYLISNAGQLYWFAAEVNDGNNGINARLTKSISVPASVSKGGSIPDWTPIGTGYVSYTGSFNGSGCTVSGLYCNTSGNVGFFGATGYNYPLTNLGVTNSTFIGGDRAGAIAGYAESSISGCWASGNTIEGNYAGGLAGQNIGFIDGSRASSNTVEGSLAGGLVGYNNNGTITRSYGTGNTVTGDSAGGLVGENYGYIENCYATGNSAGYLVGYNGDPITNCFTDGSALFRDSYGDVTNSYYVAASATDDGGRTSAQFASGEIAWLLQSGIEPEEVWDEETGEWVMADAPLVWGQSIGTASYPSLGGKRVYQVLSCDGEGTAYSNTDEQQKHNVINDVCANCGLFCPHDTGNGGICSICGATVERSMVILPASLTAVEAEAFTDTAVEAVVIPAGCTSIAAGAFSGC
ncbi:MAG: leucine-rich repeat domain-containing protein, partial [Clostridia bacterium]|nr:leucine-rich repeat domain-containing protein [Clostridia bacterium]